MELRDASPTEPTDPWQRAADFGCDMALLEEALKRSPAQRIAAHRSALALASKLRAARKQAHVRS